MRSATGLQSVIWECLLSPVEVIRKILQFWIGQLMQFMLKRVKISPVEGEIVQVVEGRFTIEARFGLGFWKVGS